MEEIAKIEPMEQGILRYTYLDRDFMDNERSFSNGEWPHDYAPKFKNVDIEQFPKQLLSKDGKYEIYYL